MLDLTAVRAPEMRGAAFALFLWLAITICWCLRATLWKQGFHSWRWINYESTLFVDSGFVYWIHYFPGFYRLPLCLDSNGVFDWHWLINFMIDTVRKEPTPAARDGWAESWGSRRTLDGVMSFCSDCAERPTNELGFALSHGCNNQTRKQPLWCFVEQKVGKTPTAIQTYIWLGVSTPTAMNKT